MNVSKRIVVAGTLALSLLVGGVALAQAGEHRRGHGPGAGEPVNLAEAEQRLLARSAEMDLNGDGVISFEEAQAYREARRLERQRAMFERRFGGDQVSVADHAAKQLEWLSRLDVNGDGVVDAEEMAAARRDGHGRHGRHGHGRRGMGRQRDQ